jgi:hypothetical protein
VAGPEIAGRARRSSGGHRRLGHEMPHDRIVPASSSWCRRTISDSASERSDRAAAAVCQRHLPSPGTAYEMRAIDGGRRGPAISCVCVGVCAYGDERRRWQGARWLRAPIHTPEAVHESVSGGASPVRRPRRSPPVVNAWTSAVETLAGRLAYLGPTDGQSNGVAFRPRRFAFLSLLQRRALLTCLGSEEC